MTEFQINCGNLRLDLGTRACIMGILNVTPDSFSDGGRFHDYDAAVAQGIRLAEQGAHILDIGGESTRPFSKPVSVQQEIDRVVPVIETLSKNIRIPISIDTVKAPVARAALDAGAAIINDVSAFEMDPDMADVAVRYQVPVVLMHMKGTPETMQENPVYIDLIQEVTDYLSARARHAVSRGIENPGSFWIRVSDSANRAPQPAAHPGPENHCGSGVSRTHGTVPEVLYPEHSGKREP